MKNHPQKKSLVSTGGNVWDLVAASNTVAGHTMSNERYSLLMRDESAELTESEIKEGWHFCYEWDGLLVGPGMINEIKACRCFEGDHVLYKSFPYGAL